MKSITSSIVCFAPNFCHLAHNFKRKSFAAFGNMLLLRWIQHLRFSFTLNFQAPSAAGITIKRSRTPFILILLSTIFSACVSAPYTNRSQFIITSEEQEHQLGSEAWQQINQEAEINTDPQYTNPVKRVGTNLAAKIKDKDYKWEFLVVTSEEPNAFCLPGGKIVVYTGLFPFLSNEAELAAVVGHEIGHAIARHGGERITQLYMQQLGSAAFAAVLASAEASADWMTVYGAATELGMILPYSRTHEYESDYIGIMLMAEAGYDPQAAITFWNKFKTLNDYGSLQEFFTTHPMGEKRVKELNDLLPEANKVYSLSNPKYGLGKPISIKK